MKPHPLLLLSASLAVVWPLQGQSLPPPEIRARSAYEFQTVPGAAYLVEGTADGQTWSTLAGPVFGDGKPARAMLPPEAGRYQKFRVRPVPAADYGPATTAVGGKTIALNDNGKVRQLILFPSIQGVTRGILKTDANHARNFVWQVKRTSKAGISMELRFKDGTGSTVDLKFSNGQLGTYQMKDRNLAGALQVMEAGAFSVHDGRIRDNPNEAVLPTVLIGQSVGFDEGGELTVMDFSINGNVVVTKPDGTTELHRYTYDVRSPGSADLRVDGPGRPPQLFQMELDSQATGNFNRLPLSLPGGGLIPGVLPQPGTFNIPTNPVLPNSAAGPPKSLDGKVIQINGDDPVTLSFSSDGTGTATREKDGSVEVEPFTYHYAPTDEDEASLALTFPGADTDRVEDYDLDFSGNTAGNYQNNTYEGGELAQTSAGSFNTATP